MIDFLSELMFQSSRSGGKGGQNVNKVETRVEARWHVIKSQLIKQEQKERILLKLAKQISLEITSFADGFKDYDKVKVVVRQFFINSISPNPATTQVSVNYEATNAANATLQVLLPNASVLHTYSINPTLANYNINISQYTPGVYTIVLYCNGIAVDSKTLQIN